MEAIINKIKKITSVDFKKPISYFQKTISNLKQSIASKAKSVTKIKTNKKSLTNVLLILLILALSATAIYIVLNPKFSTRKAMLGSFLGNILSNKSENSTDPIIQEEAATFETSKYEMEAQKGEGITHLARRAIKEHAQSENITLNDEQKIFAEDYIQKQIGDQDLELGERLDISYSLIEESITKTLELDSTQLDNLKQYSSQAYL